jgi:hypothetical protein
MLHPQEGWIDTADLSRLAGRPCGSVSGRRNQQAISLAARGTVGFDALLSVESSDREFVKS